MRATTSLPDPVGPRMSTEMSDLAAVRIHSKTTSIFSSRPIISRKRWTEGAWSSVLMAARRSRNVSNRSAMLSRCGRCAAYFGTWPGILRDDAELDELFQAVLDIQPHAAEGRHETLGFERLVGTSTQKPQQPGTQGRLHEVPESGLLVARSDRGGAVRGVIWCFHGLFAGVSADRRESDSTSGGGSR